MSGRFVLDACVAAKILFAEQGSQAAATLLANADYVVAPELILLEVTSVAIKKVRRKEMTSASAREAVGDLEGLFDQLIPTKDFRSKAMEFALGTMTSTYDAIYAALAVRESLTLVTANKRFGASLRGTRGAPDFIVLEDR
jgi:predicted nucleic acid-binding protein